MSSSLNLSFGACRLNARVTGISNVANRSIAAGSPTVDTVIFLAPIPRPHGALRIRIARVTES